MSFTLDLVIERRGMLFFLALDSVGEYRLPSPSIAARSDGRFSACKESSFRPEEKVQVSKAT